MIHSVTLLAALAAQSAAANAPARPQPMPPDMLGAGFSGAALVARGDHIQTVGAQGDADREWHVPIGVTTRFAIGSVTKSFTAVLILQLRDRGRIDLDRPACIYLASCPDAWRAITVRHLLSHRSGIPNYYHDTTDRQRVRIAPDALLAELMSRPLEAQPGTRFRYGNSSYFLLGLIIERVTGQAFAEALRINILAPAGMNDSAMDDPDRVLDRRARPYEQRSAGGEIRNAARGHVSWLNSAAGMYSTLEDLLRFQRALVRGDLLGRDTLAEMWAPQGESFYGLGWWLNEHGGRRRVSATGGITGFQSTLGYMFDDDRTVVVLCNLPSPACGDATNRLLTAGAGGERGPGSTNGTAASDSGS